MKKSLTKQSGMTRLALIIIVIAIISIISITIIFIKKANNNEVKNEQISTEENNNTTTSKVNVSMPTLTILGKEYNFPMKVSELMELGWRYSAFPGEEEDLRNKEDWLIGPNTQTGGVYCSKDNIKYMCFIIYNNTNNECPISDCLVIGVSITYDYARFSKVVEIPDNSIRIGESIVVGNSTQTEVIKELGTKNEYYSNLYTKEINYEKLDMLYYSYGKTKLSMDNHLSFGFVDGVLKTFQFVNK